MKNLILAIAMNFVFYSQAMKYNPINLNQSPPGLNFNKSPTNLQFKNQKSMTQLDRILKMLYSDPKNPGSYDPKNLDESVKSKKLIGVGMTAKVYKVKYDLENIEVVIKENELKSCEVFQREIKINEILKNKPGILKFYESLITEDPFKTHPKDFKYCFLIFELGQATLSDKIMGKDSFKNEREVVIKAQEIAIGLKSIHDAGYIHKDMKVENIIIVNGVAKISDFGFSIPDGATKSYGGEPVDNGY